MGPRPGANRYRRERLPSHAGNSEQTETGVAEGLLGEVRGDRAGRTPVRESHCGPAGSRSYRRRIGLVPLTRMVSLLVR